MVRISDSKASQQAQTPISYSEWILQALGRCWRWIVGCWDALVKKVCRCLRKESSVQQKLQEISDLESQHETLKRRLAVETAERTRIRVDNAYLMRQNEQITAEIKGLEAVIDLMK